MRNKRASQLRPPELRKKTPRILMRNDPNDQSLTRFANAASLFSLHSICRGFQIPAAIPNTIDMISNFSNNPLSITSRQAMHRYLCAIQQEGKPECSIAAQQRTLGSERKVHRICSSTSRTSRPCLHAPAARHHPDSPSIPTRKDGVRGLSRSLCKSFHRNLSILALMPSSHSSWLRTRAQPGWRHPSPHLEYSSFTRR